MIKTKEVTIEEGADAGKVFVVSQMSLLAGDAWANRAALAVLRAGVDLTPFKDLKMEDEEFVGMLDITGMVAVILKALGGIEEDVAQKLLDDLIKYIKIKLPDGGTRALIIPKDENADRSGDIASIKTLWKLRVEAIKINLDFLLAGVTP